jgi:hypothetical protein
MSRSQHSTSQVIEEMFPGVNWQGRSEIHRSISKQLTLPVGGPRSHTRIITALAHAKFGLMVYEELQETFFGCEWLLDHQDFQRLLMVDMWLGLKNQPKSVSAGMIQNPRTGNIFHRIALREGKVVCGIRFWANDHDSQTVIGFRFRVALLEEGEEQKVRQKAMETQVETSEAYSLMVSEIGIGEPTAEEELSARELLKVKIEAED